MLLNLNNHMSYFTSKNTLVYERNNRNDHFEFFSLNFLEFNSRKKHSIVAEISLKQSQHRNKMEQKN